MALDAISTPTISSVSYEDLPDNTDFWCINGNEADASTAIEIKAAPGAGKALYIDSIVLICDDDDAAPQLQDEDDNIIFGPCYGKAAGPIVVIVPFRRSLVMTANKALELKAAAAGNIFIHIQGHTSNS